MNSISCSRCRSPITDNCIKPCLCDKYYHEKCLDIIEKDYNLILNEKCLDCDEYYNIDFKDKIDEFLYRFYNIYELIYVNCNLIIYLASILIFIWDKISSLLIISIINVLNLILLGITYFKIYREISIDIVLELILLFILITIILIYDINIWLGLSFYIFNLNIARISKTYIYLFSTKYHYIKIYNFARLN